MGCLWSTTGVLWSQANWLWPNPCSPTPPEPILSIPIHVGVDATTLIQPWIIEPWNPYRAGEIKKKKLVRLICKIKGEKYNEEKEVKNINISVDDINLIKSDSIIDLNVNAPLG